eukprot:6464512-Amphidinium_carterae.1
MSGGACVASTPSSTAQSALTLGRVIASLVPHLAGVARDKAAASTLTTAAETPVESSSTTATPSAVPSMSAYSEAPGMRIGSALPH